MYLFNYFPASQQQSTTVNNSQQQSTNLEGRQGNMGKRIKRELMMITYKKPLVCIWPQ